MIYTDRQGRNLQIGQHLRVRECIGSYGQCATREGVLQQLSPYGGGTLKLTKPATVYGRNYNEHKNPGDLIYVCLERNGYKKFNDFEHGHETWTEIIGENNGNE